MVLKLPQGHEDSEYVLSFEIGQREGGFYSARTDTHRQTDRITDTPNTVLVYRRFEGFERRFEAFPENRSFPELVRKFGWSLDSIRYLHLCGIGP